MLNDTTEFVQTLFDNPTRAIATGLLFLFIYLYIAKRKENDKLRAKLNDEKQAFYFNLFVYLNMVMKGKVDVTKDEDLKKLVELDSKLKLFSNDEVVKAWGDWWRTIFLGEKSSPKKMLEAYGYLQLAIRRDLGSSGVFTTLSWFDFSRSTTNDLEDYLDQKDKKYRTYSMKKVDKMK